jgi:uncharacterized protein YkwD
MKKAVAAAVAGVALGPALLAPSAATAREHCLFQNMKVSADNVGRVERSLFCLTNLHRVRNGLHPLRRDARLGAAAGAHSADMVARDYFGHFTPEGDGPGDRARASGYPGGAGENIAANGIGSAFSLFDQWRNSSGHNQNMLNGFYRAAGFGIAPAFPGGGGPGITGTQMFGITAANRDDSGLGLYASGARCAKAKRLRLKLLAQKAESGKQGLPKLQQRRLHRAEVQIRNRCEPPG